MESGRRRTEPVSKVDRSRRYTLEDACALLQTSSFARFDESVDIAVRLGLNTRHADQQVRSATVLPHGVGKAVRVLVFAKGEKAIEAETAGADHVGASDLVKRVQDGWLDFETVIATPDMMGEVGRLGRILGPRGLMPNPKVGTVTFDVSKAVQEVKAGKVEFRAEKTGAIVHAPVGKRSFETQKLVENIRAFLEAVMRAKPSGAKGTYLRSITLSTTMGPGIRIDPASVVEA